MLQLLCLSLQLMKQLIFSQLTKFLSTTMPASMEAHLVLQELRRCSQLISLLLKGFCVVDGATCVEFSQILVTRPCCHKQCFVIYANTAHKDSPLVVINSINVSGFRPNVNTRSIIYCNAIRHSDDLASDWEFLYEQYQNSSVSEDSLTILSALGCATDTTILQE